MSTDESIAGVKMSLSQLGVLCMISTTIAAVISDVLLPLAPISAYIVVLLLLVLLLILLLKMVSLIDVYISGRYGNSWFIRSLTVTIIPLVAFIIVYSYHGVFKKKGILASEFAFVESLQLDLGLIDENIQNISDGVAEIANNTSAILTLKRETSDDARKELANLGLAWNLESFVDSMRSGDLEVLELYLTGGMRPEQLYKGASAILYGMQNQLDNNPVGILKLAVTYGFDLNATLVDSVIMSDRANGYLPDRYEADNKPKGYRMPNGNRYEGPIFMWMVMLNMYYLSRDSDFAILNYLIEQNVDRSTTLGFLEYRNKIRKKHDFGMPNPGAMAIYDLLGYDPSYK